MLLHIESKTIKCYYKFNRRNLSIKLKGTLEGKKKTEVDSHRISTAVKGQRVMKVIPPIITLSFPQRMIRVPGKQPDILKTSMT